MESSAQTETTHFNTDSCLLLANKILLKEAEKGSNFVASPLSLHLMLSLAAAGSRGRTLEELLSFLGSENIENLNLLSSKIVALTSKVHGSDSLTAGPMLSFVNGAWVDQRFGLKPSFEEVVRGVYGAMVKGVDFVSKADESTQEVNSWAENTTKGLIKDLLPPGFLDSTTALVLANALYFKGSWNRKFNPSKTKNIDFHLLNGHIVQVPCVTCDRYERHQYRTYDGYKLLKISYQNGLDTTRQFAIYLFLPNAKDGLPSLIQMVKSNSGFLSREFDDLWEEELPEFWIPRFKFSFKFEASEELKEMNVKLPFMNVGDFSEMVDSPDSDKLYVSKMFHQAYVEVNEEGTEAAATTALQFRKLCARLDVPSFVADHPFMFMIREDRSRIVLFVGAVLNPILDA